MILFKIDTEAIPGAKPYHKTFNNFDEFSNMQNQVPFQQNFPVNNNIQYQNFNNINESIPVKQVFADQGKPQIEEEESEEDYYAGIIYETIERTHPEYSYFKLVLLERSLV